MANDGFFGAGSAKKFRHDKAYWDRIKEEFRTGRYPRSGAYGSYDHTGAIKLEEKVDEQAGSKHKDDHST